MGYRLTAIAWHDWFFPEIDIPVFVGKQNSTTELNASKQVHYWRI